jgi:hypothetical protein
MEVLSNENQNLTKAQKELLLDHHRLGHINMQTIQQLYQDREVVCEFDGCENRRGACLTPKNNLAPIEIFTRQMTNCEFIRRAKVFGCPVYVLEPRLQDGKKIPKWEPRARRAQFLGFSKEHSSLSALVRNL